MVAREPSGGVFVCYRREDSAYAAGWLYKLLRDRLGSRAIFKDVDNLRPGDDFVAEIDAAVSSCAVLVAVIGREWLEILDDEGRRRLDDPNDLVRLEIEAALTRRVRVVPVLVSGARMPDPSRLPPSLAPLTRRHALELTPGHFEVGAQQLLAVIEQALVEGGERGLGGGTEPGLAMDTERPPDGGPDAQGTPAVPGPAPLPTAPLPSVPPSPRVQLLRSRRVLWLVLGLVVLAVLAVVAVPWPRMSGSTSSAFRVTVEPPRNLGVDCELTLNDVSSGAVRDLRGSDGFATRTYQVPNRDWVWTVSDSRAW